MQNIQDSTTVGAAICTNVIGEFRDTIAAAGTALSLTDTELPDIVRNHAVNRIRWLWLSEFPALKALQTDARKSLAEAAEKMLAQISSRDVKVPPGDGSAADQSPSPKFGTRGSDAVPLRNFTDATQSGI